MNEYDLLEHTDINTALAWHLQYNHYPAVPLSMMNACIIAIDNAIAEDWDAEVMLPDGVTYKDRLAAPTWAIVTQHHLHAFIESATEDK